MFLFLIIVWNSLHGEELEEISSFLAPIRKEILGLFTHLNVEELSNVEEAFQKKMMVRRLSWARGSLKDADLGLVLWTIYL